MTWLKWIGGLLGLLLAIAVALYIFAGREQRDLDQSEQENAPGEFAALDAGRLHYRLEGPADGPLIVLVHGFSTPNFIFEQNVEALHEAGFRTLRYDHFGRGWSDRPGTRYDADFYDETLTQLLDALEIDGAFGLVGLSMGGLISAEFAARHPDRVSRLFLFVPAGLDTAGAEGITATLLGLPVIGDWFWRLNWRRALLSDPQYDESALAPENRLAGDVTQQMAYRGYGEALLSTLRHMPMAGQDSVFQRLAATGTPVMAVFGEADPTVRIASADRLAQSVPDAVIRRLPEAGHGLNYQNHQTVNPWLVDWFSAPVPAQ